MKLDPVVKAYAAASLLCPALAFVTAYPCTPHVRSRTTMMAAKLTPVPRNGARFDDETRRQSQEAVAAALKAGVKKLEVEVPIKSDKIDVSLGEFLDETRAWTRDFVRAYASMRKNLWVIFPDGKESTLANRAWGEVPFRIFGLERAIKAPKEDPCDLMVVVNPGFNVDEYLNLEKLERGAPIIIVNGSLDRVRSGYYPRIFYPGLYAAKERFIKYFDPVFYLKPMPGGALFRKYGEPWQWVLQYYGGKDRKTIMQEVVKTTEERPPYNDVSAFLKSEGSKKSARL